MELIDKVDICSVDICRGIDCEKCSFFYPDNACLLRERVFKLKTVDAEPIKHGEWILEREPDGKPYCLHCSICDVDFRYIGIKTAYDFCPNCGAKMDEEIKEIIDDN